MENAKKLNIYDILILISILFIGTDVFSISIAGMSIRFIQIFYILFAFYLLINQKYKIYVNPLAYLFLIVASISTIFALDRIQSFAYYIWIIYDLIILMPIIYFYIGEYGPQRLLKIFTIVYVILFILTMFQFLIDGVFNIEIPFLSCQHHLGVMRPALWFYEPSYLATFMLIYFSMSCYLFFAEKKYTQLIMICLTGICISLITSTTGFIGMLLAVLFSYIIFFIKSKSLKERLISIFIVIFGIGLVTLLIYLLMPKVFELFIMRIFRSGIVKSKGARITDYINQIKAWASKPLFGVGLDCYGVFRNNKDIVASNITLELLATTGIFGCVSFYMFALYPFFRVFFTKNNFKTTKCFAFGLIILVIILQANQNFMRLYLWMMIFITYASMHYESNKEEDDKNEVVI